jgi:glycosyltransferase involved in cell wall biosynthesis
MKIAQVAPLIESVPPKMYGGTERIVSYITEELVRQGHAVTLFASGDSVTRADLVAGCKRSLRLDDTCIDPNVHHIRQLEKLWSMSAQFDVIHNHMDYLPFPVLRRLATPSLTTLHGRLDLPDLVPLYKEYDDIPLVSISNSQRKPLGAVNWQATVYHGLPQDLYQLKAKTGSYLAFLGRCSPEKGLVRAIEIARKADIPIKIAAKIDRTEYDYFKAHIEPLLTGPFVEFLGEIKDSEKNEFLGDSLALLFPIDWPEPFGVTLIEAMACGTPSVAFNRGAVPELAVEGVTGFIVETVAEAVAALDNVADLDRTKIRQVFEERFSATRMVADYLTAYQACCLSPAVMEN